MILAGVVLKAIGITLAIVLAAGIILGLVFGRRR